MTTKNDKERIKLSFNKAWKTYDEYCSVQKKICHDCTELMLHHKNSFDVIADFACGTGLSTQCLTKNIIYKKCYAIDIAENLLNVAKNKSIDNVEFISSDFDEQLFCKNHLDFIFCNMGLQWSLNLLGTLKLFNAYLKKTGSIVFSMPIEGNFPEIKKGHKNILHHPDNIKKMLEQNNFEVTSFSIKSYAEKFPNCYEALKSLKATGTHCTIPPRPYRTSGLSKSHINHVFLDAKNLSLTYKIALFSAKKRVQL